MTRCHTCLTALRATRAQRVLPPLRRWNHLSPTTPASSSTSSARLSDGPVQHSYTLKEIDNLLTSIASSAKTTSHPSPLAMRSFSVPWLSSQSPNLASQGKQPDKAEAESAGRMSEAELARMLEPKHMSESYTSFDLPLRSDKQLFERYVNQQGGFRMGKLLEHLDSLAGAVAYRHCLPAPDASSSQKDASVAFREASARAGLYLATASADRLDMLGKLTRDNARDLKFSGFVTWTGNSSMEVVVKMQASKLDSTSGEASASASGEWDTLMLGRFAMVCRDSKTQKARKVPPLIVESEEEKMLWQLGEDYQQRRKATSKIALDKVPPSSAEAADLHSLMIKVNDQKIDTIEGEKILSSVQLMFPQDRNLHGKVFGGILMRLAFELCFTNAAVFASEPMRFLSLDQIQFRLPVPIGAVLHLTSKVVRTTLPKPGPDGEAKAHIQVRAEVEEVETGLRRETNTFYFTMAKEDPDPIGRVVVPSTYNEAMTYLEGERRLDLGDEMRRLYKL